MKQYLFLLLILSFTVISCNQKVEYEEWAKNELTKEVQRDSLFLGYHFGMTRQEFYDHSWSLNKQKKVIQGEGNRSVMYQTDELDHRAKMNFYPKFHEEKIYIMPVQYSYNAWAPWNKDLWSDTLLVNLLDLYEEKYDADFKQINHPDLGRPAYTSIQGNRSITMLKKDDQHVIVTFTDLNVREKIKESGEYAGN